MLLPTDVQAKLAVCKPPGPGPSDFPCWNLTNDGNFSLKSAYSVLHKEAVEPTIQGKDPLFQRVWKWQGSQCYRAFLWKLVHERLLSNVERVRRGMAHEDTCPRCHSSPETNMHLLRDWDDVRDFWYKVVDPEKASRFFSMGMEDWIAWNLAEKDVGIHSNVQWDIFFRCGGL